MTHEDAGKVIVSKSERSAYLIQDDGSWRAMSKADTAKAVAMLKAQATKEGA